MIAVPNSNIQILNCVTDDLQTVCHAQFVHLHAKLRISSHNVSTVITVIDVSNFTYMTEWMKK
jgi:hypothetical protein